MMRRFESPVASRKVQQAAPFASRGPWLAGCVAATLALVACGRDTGGAVDGAPGATVQGPSVASSEPSPATHGSPSGSSNGTSKPSVAPLPTIVSSAGAEPPVHLASGPASFAPIAKHADPSVVTIRTTGAEVEPAPYFSHRSVRHETKGLGTGFIVDRDGVILTNNHVIKDADVITVRLSNDREYPATIVGRDPRTDMAVVKIDEHGLVPLALGDSDAIDVGDWVVAIGNPFGLSHTVSAGIISAKGRNHDDVPLDPTGYYSFLQTDASINPGNSGGPLLNLKGEVVGINTAIRGGGAQGIGFAIPINMVKQLLPMLLRDGHVTRSALGVRILDVAKLSPQERQALKLPDAAKGALVEYATPNGPAAKAGLKPGDVIETFEGTPVEGGSLQWQASTAGVGRSVALKVAREGKVFDAKVTLGLLEEAAPAREDVAP
jgi:serine protease Do